MQYKTSFIMYSNINDRYKYKTRFIATVMIRYEFSAKQALNSLPTMVLR